MRATLAILALLVALAPWLAVRALDPGDGSGAVIRARPIPLDSANPGHRVVGRLAYLDGWVLSSRDRRFGGFSALVPVGPDRLLAVSDAGDPLAIAIRGAQVTARLGPTLITGAPAHVGKAGADIESLARDPGSGLIWAGLERYDAIVRYRPDLSHPVRAEPPAMRRWPGNGGAEAMTRLGDGRFMLIAERVSPAPGLRTALLFPHDPARPGARPVTLSYRPPPGFDPSDAAALPDGRVLVLNRRLSFPHGFTAMLTLVDPRRAHAGTVLEPVTIATLAPPLAVDNMEGVAVSIERGETIVTLISDDNFMPFERTLLMRFRLLP